MVYKTNCSQKKISKNTVYKTSLSPKRRVCKTNLSPKKNLQEIGLQNKLFTKKTSPKKRSTKHTFHQKKLKKTVYKKGIGHKCSPRKRSTQGPWPQKMRKIKPYEWYVEGVWSDQFPYYLLIRKWYFSSWWRSTPGWRFLVDSCMPHGLPFPRVGTWTFVSHVFSLLVYEKSNLW